MHIARRRGLGADIRLLEYLLCSAANRRICTVIQTPRFSSITGSKARDLKVDKSVRLDVHIKSPSNVHIEWPLEVLLIEGVTPSMRLEYDTHHA